MKRNLFLLCALLFCFKVNSQKTSTPKFPAQLDAEFASGTTIKVATLSDLQINNLYKLAKVWGYVKYYHPTIAAGKLNWDFELFRVLPKILEAENELEAENKMLSWLQNVLKDTINVNAKKAKSKNLKLAANNDWLRDKTLKNSTLNSWLLGLEYAEKPKEHYYIGFTEGVGNPIFKHELPYVRLDFTDDGVKLLALFRYWNMINYFFPYRYLMDENWDKILKTFIPKLINADEDLAYKLNLLELIGKVQDTHANIWQDDDTLHWFWGNNKVPVEVKMIENQVVVTSINDSLAVGDLQIGDVITAINNKQITAIIEEKIKYCPASNRPTQLRNVMRLLLRTNETSLDLAIKGKKNQQVNAVTMMLLPQQEEEILPHKLLDGNIGYIYPGTLEANAIEDIMQQYKGTKGLIIDLRCYPAEFIVYKLGKYLMPVPKKFVKFTFGNSEKAGDFSMGNSIAVGELRPNYYKGKIVILVNEETQSQAEFSAMAWRVAPKATVIGSTTAGADGDMSFIVLPGNIRTIISGIGIYYPDGKETQRVGIVPDIEVHPTIKGVKNKEDELLNKAIEVIKQ